MASPYETTITTKAINLGGDVTITVKRFGDGTMQYSDGTTTVKSTQTDLQTFTKGLIVALGTLDT